MSNNPGFHVFTDESLKEHNRQIAAKVHQATVTSTVRKINKMNPGQLLHASRNNGKGLYWSLEKLDKVLAHISLLFLSFPL
ncbi:hypothetical protein, partial [Marichromatium sp. AB32]|uniref:hypothetical protein n=1 Tax=Marichromatium sp. AB32 TaxID=2483363 RepID=UPI001CC1F197